MKRKLLLQKYQFAATLCAFLVAFVAYLNPATVFGQTTTLFDAMNNQKSIFERGDIIHARTTGLNDAISHQYGVYTPITRANQLAVVCEQSSSGNLNSSFQTDDMDRLTYGVLECPAGTPDALSAPFDGGMYQYRLRTFTTTANCTGTQTQTNTYFRLAEAYAFRNVGDRTTAAADACEVIDPLPRTTGDCDPAELLDFCPGSEVFMRIRGFFPCRTNVAYSFIKPDGTVLPAIATTSPTSGNINVNFVIPNDATMENIGLWQIRIGLTDGGNFIDSRTVDLDAFNVRGNRIFPHKFHDINMDGVKQANEPFLAGWRMDLSGDAFGTDYTRPAGWARFAGLPNGTFIVTEGTLPNFIPTTPISREIVFDAENCGDDEEIFFGNVCIGGATNAKSKGWWGNKNGLKEITKPYFCELNGMCLRNLDGTHYDPIVGCPTPSNTQLSNAKSSFDTWLQQANGSNMASMLSAQLAAMKLNVMKGFVAPSNVIYAPGTNSANLLGFATINAIIMEANQLLCTGGSDPLIILSGHALRDRATALKDALDYGNNNMNFLLNTSCEVNFPTNGNGPARLAANGSDLDGLTLATYPNPLTDRTTISYTLPEAGNVSLIVYDGFGRQVAVLQDGMKQAGAHETNWNAVDMASGIYFCRMAITTETGAQQLQTTKMILLK